MSDKLTIHLGPDVNAPDGYRMMLGDEDITERLSVRRISIEASGHELVKVHLEVHADTVHVIADSATFTVVDDAKDS